MHAFARFRAAALALVVLALVALIGVSPAAAAGATSETETEHAATDAFTDVIPCLGDALYDITLTYNEVDHLTTLPNGTVHATFTQTGTFAAVPAEDASLPSFSGHFTQWGGFNGNRKNATGTFTFTIHGTGSDGSQVDFHETAHFSLSATGLTVEFDKISC
jgi:hypothetical protein